MSTIIAGTFKEQEQAAQVLDALMSSGFSNEEVTSFFVNPPGQHALHAGGGSFKSQMKKADRSGAHHAVILGDEEVHAGELTLKPMLGRGEQARMTLELAIERIKAEST